MDSPRTSGSLHLHSKATLVLALSSVQLTHAGACTRTCHAVIFEVTADFKVKVWCDVGQL